jgi:hypothetical protein
VQDFGGGLGFTTMRDARTPGRRALLCPAGRVPGALRGGRWAVAALGVCLFCCMTITRRLVVSCSCNVGFAASRPAASMAEVVERCRVLCLGINVLAQVQSVAMGA